VRAAARKVLNKILAGRVPWLWTASVAGGICRRQLARLWHRLVFVLVVQPIFFLVQLFVYLVVRSSDAFLPTRSAKTARLPRAVPGNGKVAVIIPNYRGEHYLGNLLESLARQTWPDLEVLVVDNDSRDGSEAVVRRFANARWIPTGANRGFAHAVNRGAREAADAEFLALLNNDTVVEPDWAQRQVEALRADPRLGMVGARIYLADYDRLINIHAHVLGSDLRSYNIGAGTPDEGQFDDGQRVLGVSGCSMMIRNESFWDAHGFDEQFFLCYEDLDFSLRMYWRGWDCRVVPRAVCHHVSTVHIGTGSALHVRNLLHHDLLWLVKDIPSKLMARHAAPFLRSALSSDDVRLFYQWQGWKIVLWRLQALPRIFRALRTRKAVQKSLVRAPEDLSEFIRPAADLQIGHALDNAERYLVARMGFVPQGPRRELFPQGLVRAEGFEEGADLSTGATSAGNDPQVLFQLGAASRKFRWIDVEMTSDQTAWGQFVMVCRHAQAGPYFLQSNHFRVMPGRHRYAFPVNGRFFLGRIGPDLLGYWRRDLAHLRFDPCESNRVRVAIHSFGVS
jgi:GT2 family glycosyltransferase